MKPRPRTLYTARTRTIGGRERGISRSSDGRLDVRLSLHDSPRIGSNPEQLFAAAWSACFEHAIAIVARKRQIALPAGIVIDAEIDLNVAGDGYVLSARLNVTLPGVAPDVARSLVDEAHATCPYSKAIRGNIEVAVTLV